MIDWEIIRDAIPAYMQGLRITLLLLVLSISTGFILSVPLAMARVSRHRWLSGPVWLYTYVFFRHLLFFQDSPYMI